MVTRRIRLRRAAQRLAAAGWPVTPGACLRADRFDCGRPGCPTTSCHPALEDWEHAASRDPVRIADWWRYAPHSVLLPTGYACDVLEVSAALGAQLTRSAGWTGATRGPTATLPTGTWLLLVRPGTALLPELAGRLEIVCHGRGSWVPAPPTPLREGHVRWRVSPTEVDWQLPPAAPVQEALAAVLGTTLPQTRQRTPLDRAA